jgi:hypothetical protein
MMDHAQASLLDRLIDEDPGSSGESDQHRLLNARQVKAFVVRDLENLLNSRRPRNCRFSFTGTESFGGYGLKDFTAENTTVRTESFEGMSSKPLPDLNRVLKLKVDLETGSKKENLAFAYRPCWSSIRFVSQSHLIPTSIRKEYVGSKSIDQPRLRPCEPRHLPRPIQ